MTAGRNPAAQVIDVQGMGVAAAADAFVRLCSEAGFTVVALGPSTFRAARTRRPQWATVTAICTALFAGVGLLFLLVKRTESGDASIVEERTGTKLRITGQLPPALVSQISAVLSQRVEHRSIGSERSLAERWAPTEMPGGATTGPIPAPFAATSSAPLPPPRVVVPSPSPSAMPAAYGAALPDATVRRGAPQSAPSSAAPPTVVLVLPDARTVAVGDGVVIGRSPQPDPNAPSASLVSFDDLSLSRTHLSVLPSNDGVWIVDHHSTNGTRVISGMSNVQCVPGARAAAPFGSIVVAGEVQLTVGAS